MLIESIAVSFIVLPISLINITICVPELTLTVCLVIVPFSFVFTTVGPNLGTPTLLDTLL